MIVNSYIIAQKLIRKTKHYNSRVWFGTLYYIIKTKTTFYVFTLKFFKKE